MKEKAKPMRYTGCNTYWPARYIDLPSPKIVLVTLTFFRIFYVTLVDYEMTEFVLCLFFLFECSTALFNRFIDGTVTCWSVQVKSALHVIVSLRKCLRSAFQNARYSNLIYLRSHYRRFSLNRFKASRKKTPTCSCSTSKYRIVSWSRSVGESTDWKLWRRVSLVHSST